MAILNDSDFVEVEGRYYTNPQVALDESNRFIDNLRSTQQANNQQIQTETYNLGTAVPSNLGGLTSPVTDGNGGAGMSYFTSRYQTPQTSSAVANLRAAAQAQALNEVLANEQAIWKNRYQNAYRDYQRRASRGGGGNGGGGGGNNPASQNPAAGEVEEKQTMDEQFDVKQDMNTYGYDTTIYDSTEVAHDNRSTERNKNIKVIKNKDGSIRNLYIDGVNHTGREAQARYRYLKNAGLVE